MIEVEIQFSGGPNTDLVVQSVEQVCTANGLICARRGTLASYPDCVHWHYRKDKDTGTLEITWWETENRLWFKVAKSRRGDWIDESLPQLKKEIEAHLK